MPSLSGVRFVVDENLLRLGQALDQLRRDIALIGRTPISEILPAGAGDSEWIPIVGDRGWVMITNDQRIRTRPSEAGPALDHRLKVVHLHGNVGNQSAWAQAVRLFARWESIEEYAETHPDGPWWLSARQQRLVPMKYDPGAVDRV